MMKIGEVYTKPYLADFVLARIGFPRDESAGKVALLDPACGNGVFLVAAAKRLRERLLNRGFPAQSIVDTVLSSIYGVDINPAAVAAAKKSLLSVLEDEFHSLSRRGGVSWEADPQIYVADSLKSGPVASSTSGSHSLFSQIASQTAYPKEKFNFIVGNPPYVRIQDMSRDKASRYRQEYIVAYGAFDMYALFFEQCLAWLRHDGFLAFITPDKYMHTVQGRFLRTLLSKSYDVREIILLDGEHFSETVTVNSAITIVRNRRPDSRRKIRVAHAIAEEPGRDLDEQKVVVTTDFKVPSREIGSEFWILRPPSEREILAEIIPSMDSIGDLLSVSTAIPTGLNSVYVLPELTALELSIESELLVPVIRGRNIHRWFVDYEGEFLLYPYMKDDTGVRPVTLDEFPRAMDYLETRRYELEQRKRLRKKIKAGKLKWFEMIDPRDPELMTSVKIVTPDLWSTPRFALDREGFYCLNSVYILTPRDARGQGLELTTAWLNGSVCSALLRTTCPRVNGSYYRMSCSHLEQLPVLQLGQEAINIAREIIRTLSLAATTQDRNWADQAMQRGVLTKYERDLNELFIDSMPLDLREKSIFRNFVLDRT